VPGHCTAALSHLGYSVDTLRKEQSGHSIHECVFPRFVALLSLWHYNESLAIREGSETCTPLGFVLKIKSYSKFTV